MTDRFRFVAVRRAGRVAIVRVLHSGEVAGYDPVADREQRQRHFRVHRGPAAYDAAFDDSRKYTSFDAAVADATASGRRVEATAVARHEERPVEGTGWYVYVGGEDAGGPFGTEADALEAWQS
jgi:hypothetical protein